jgi:hypothetical protein
MEHQILENRNKISMKKIAAFLLPFSFLLITIYTLYSCKNVSASSSSGEAVSALGGLVVAVQPFELTGETSAANMKLHWNSIEGAANYAVYRSTDGDSYTQINFSGSTIYDDYAISGDKCYYKVKAVKTNGKTFAVSSVVAGTVIPESSSLNVYDNTTYTSFIKRSSLKVDDTYYNYVYSNSNGQVTLTEYTSTDGLNFTVGNVVMDPSHSVITNSDITGGSTSGELYSCKLEAMSVVQKDNQIVIWAHYENASDYSLGRVVCISGTAGGGYFTYHGSFQPENNDSRDMTFFEDTNGTGYIVSASDTNTNLRIYRLTSDWTDVDTTFDSIIVCENQGREAPALIKQDGWYYLFSSAAAGWYPSSAKYISARTISELAAADMCDIGNTQTFGAQSGGIKKIGDQYVMMANRWSSGWAAPDPILSALGKWSSQRMLPISLSNGCAFYDYYYNIKYNCDFGILIPVQDGRNLSLNADTSLSNTGQTGYTAEFANDGISDESDNYYNPNATSGVYNYIVDLGAKCKIAEVDVTFRVYKGSEVYNTYTIDGSMDGSTWTILQDKSDNTIIGFNENVINDTSAYRYVRLHVTGLYRASTNASLDASWVRGIHEFSVYGTY